MSILERLSITQLNNMAIQLELCMSRSCKNPVFYRFTREEMLCKPCLDEIWLRVGRFFVAGGGLTGAAPARTKANCSHKVAASPSEDGTQLICDTCGADIPFYSASQ